MHDWLAANLVCPRDLGELQREAGKLTCSAGHHYPIVDDIPVMLIEEAAATHESQGATFERISGAEAPRASLGSSEPNREAAPPPAGAVDAYVQRFIVETCGNLYRPLVNRLTRYPIPELRLPSGSGGLMLDIGCNWGRWCVAAARKGYRPVGIDTSLEAILAARRVSCQLGAAASYVVADARYLPFRTNSFDMVFSYSVLQHFSKENAHMALGAAARVLKPGGICLVQMPNRYGLRCMYHQIGGWFREARRFQVRYWTVGELRNAFGRAIGPASVSVDGYFGLGVQRSDIDLLPLRYKCIVLASEALRRMSEKAPFMKYFADSLYVRSVREGDLPPFVKGG